MRHAPREPASPGSALHLYPGERKALGVARQATAARDSAALPWTQPAQARANQLTGECKAPSRRAPGGHPGLRIAAREPAGSGSDSRFPGGAQSPPRRAQGNRAGQRHFGCPGGAQSPSAPRDRRPRRTAPCRLKSGGMRSPRDARQVAILDSPAPQVVVAFMHWGSATPPQRCAPGDHAAQRFLSRAWAQLEQIGPATLPSTIRPRAGGHSRARRRRPEVRRAAGRARGRRGRRAVRGTARRHRLRALGGRTTHPCPRARRPPIPYRYAHDRASGGRPEAPQGDQGVSD